MNSKPVTLIISDLHVGGGPSDKGDDFIYAGDPFPRLLAEQADTPEGRRGEIELIINGDFLEFAQTVPDAYRLDSAEFWCNERESVRKLDAIMAGHPELFKAMADFQKSGNRVTLMAGNHDVELYWDEVQRRIRKAAGPDVVFELGEIWSRRYGGLLRISHGHMIDPANRFENWRNPTRPADGGELRLEMCPGTLFVIKFVNWLEKDYPFADNLHPVTKLGSLLWRESKWGLLAVAWTLTGFLKSHPGAALGLQSTSEMGKRVRQAIATDDGFAGEVTDLWRRSGEGNASVSALRARLSTDDDLQEFLMRTMSSVDMRDWLAVFDQLPGGVLGVGGGPGVLAVVKAGAMTKEAWRREAASQWLDDGQIVVMGHTHEPDEVRDGDNAYYNPGAWTRYVEEARLEGMTLADLKREEDFPYQLNYVRVARGAGGRLESEMVCFESGA